jgi:hypothetical protein
VRFITRLAHVDVLLAESEKAPLAVTQVTLPSRMFSPVGNSTFDSGLDLPAAPVLQ